MSLVEHFNILPLFVDDFLRIILVVDADAAMISGYLMMWCCFDVCFTGSFFATI